MIGQRIGPYEIIEEIGKGGMATVYRAYQPSLDRFVAVKIIHRAIALDTASLERFQREARLLTRLVHPHLLPIYDYNAEHDPPYIVMRYLDSGTLKGVIDKGGLPHEELIYMLRQVASALDYAHRNNVIHRDIKPSNVMLDEDGNAFLTDFGIARTIEAGQDMTQSGFALGTPGYMSPEQGMGVDGLNSRSDIYSLGVMTFQMLTGKMPYTGETPLSIIFKHISDPIPDINKYDPQLSSETNVVFARVMAKQPEDRYATATEFVDDLAKSLHVTGAGSPMVLKKSAQANKDEAAAKRIELQSKIEATMQAFAASRASDTAPKVPETQSLPEKPVEAKAGLPPPIPLPLKKPSNRLPLMAGIVTILAILALVLITLRNNGSLVPTATNTALAVVPSATATRIKPSATSTLTPTATVTLTATSTSTPTATSTLTSTPSFTPTVTTPEAHPLRAVILRTGPGSQYPKLADIAPDERLMIIGASEDGAWLKIRLTDKTEGWLAFNPATLDFRGNIQAIPLALAPTDTPSFTPTATSTSTATATPTTTYTPTASATPTFTVTPSATPTFTATSSMTPTLTLTPSATATLTPTVATPEGPTLTPPLQPTPTPIPPGQLPFVADFEDPGALDGWDYDSAAWQVVNDGGENLLVGTGTLQQPIVILGSKQPEWQSANSGSLVISFNINLDRQSGGARIIFRCADLNGCQTGYNALDILPGTMILRRNGDKPDITNRDAERSLRRIDANIAEQTWYEVRIWIEGSRIYVYLNNQLMMAVDDLNTPQLGGGAILLQTNSIYRPVRWDNIIIQRPDAASQHFEAQALPRTWQTTSPSGTTIGSDNGNFYLRMQNNVTVKPSTTPLRDVSLTCRVWVEQGGYILSIRQSDSGSVALTVDKGDLLIQQLNSAGTVMFSRLIANGYALNAWDDLSVSFIGDHLQISRNGQLLFEETVTGLPSRGDISFHTRTGDALRLDDCLITEAAASSNASARFALALQQQVYARSFREPSSDLSESFDDQFRTSVYWVNAARAAGDFRVDAGASVHQKFLRMTYESVPVFRIIRGDVGAQLFGAGEDNINYSDSSDFLASVDIRLPQSVGTAWLGVRSSLSLGGSSINGYKFGLRRNPDATISVIVRYQDSTHDISYYDDLLLTADNTLPEWITLTAIAYKQRIAFFANGHFITSVDKAQTLGGTVALGMDSGTTADFDDLTIRDTTPYGN
jgi:serine/threonine-protein kinase